ncbi:hypothetical protein HDU98_007446 [Podochytrium sp. JEL0797]|nr:hypothetical protein HDU98_007446 [Podochytrium sp. JEL0797]
MRKETTRLARVRHVFLDLAKWGWELAPNTVGSLLDCLMAERVESLVLDASYATASNQNLIHFISLKLTSLHNLSITGHATASILHGLTSKSLHHLTSISPTLTRLSLSSFGAHSFSLPSLLTLLTSCKSSLQQLSLTGGPIPEGGLNLTQIGNILGPTLTTLSLSFSFVGLRTFPDPPPTPHLETMSEHQMMGWEPVLHGDLSLFPRLHHLSLSDSGPWHPSRILEDFPTHLIRRLLSPSNASTTPINVTLHFESLNLTTLHVPHFYVSILPRLESLYVVGNAKRSKPEDTARRLNHLLDMCVSLRRFGANYTRDGGRVVMELVAFQERGVELVVL